MERPKVVKVTKTEFELDNGVVYPYVVVLDEVPSTEEFQAMYDHWKQLIMDESKTDAFLRGINKHNQSSQNARGEC